MSETEVKKCPKCGGEMLEGRLVGSYNVSIGFDTSGSFWFPKHEKITAFVCRKCGFLELYSKVKQGISHE